MCMGLYGVSVMVRVLVVSARVRTQAGSRELMDLEPIRKGLPQLHRDMKRLFDKLRSQASSTEG